MVVPVFPTIHPAPLAFSMRPAAAVILLLLGVPPLLGCTRTGASDAPATLDEASPGAATDSAAKAAADKGATPDNPLAITWDDLNIPLPADSTYESWMLTSRAKAVLDRYVQISGYMYGGIAQKDAIRTFPLLRDKDCPFGPGGHAHHAIEVNLQGRLRTGYTSAPVTVEGFLTVAPFTGTDGKTWSVYHLEGTKIQ